MNPSDLLKINVSDRTEKKNGLTYLSWAWAWATVLEVDPTANFEVEQFTHPDNPNLRVPYQDIGGSCIVWVSVTIFGKTAKVQLPVLDYRNKCIPAPNAFDINTSIMRCLTKGIAMHGLGLYIYAGEDLPEGAPSPTEEEDWNFEQQHLANLREAAMGGMDALAAAFKELPTSQAKSRFWAKHQASLKAAAQGAKND